MSRYHCNYIITLYYLFLVCLSAHYTSM